MFPYFFWNIISLKDYVTQCIKRLRYYVTQCIKIEGTSSSVLVKRSEMFDEGNKNWIKGQTDTT